MSSADTEVDRHAAPVRQSVVAAGDAVPAEGDKIENLAEGDRHHREIDAAQMNDQPPDNRRGNHGGRDADQHADERVRNEVFDRHARPVGGRGRNRPRGRTTGRR